MWNIDWNVVAQGAQLTVLGMGLVFLALSLVVLAMVILTRLPWLQVREKEEIGKSANRQIGTDERARVAAIAVALALSEEHPHPQITASGWKSAWKMQGRVLQLR